MDGDGDPRDPRARLTVALAIAVIVATVALLVIGMVVAPTGSGPAEEEETARASASAPAHDDDEVHGHDDGIDVVVAGGPPTTAHGHDASGEHGDGELAAAAPAGSEADADHGHAEPAVPASSGGSPAADVGHGHDDVAVASPTSPVTVPATDAHGDHQVTTTVPGAPTTSTTVATAGPIISLDDPRLSASQQAAAQDLLDRTTAAMAAFPDEAAVLAAGYVSIGDGVTGFEHFVNVAYLSDGLEVDPDHIESIVLKVQGGTKTVASAMYILATGSTMADVPDIAGELTTWHDHQNLCWEGIRVVGILRPDGTCARGEFRATAPMLHVWLTEQPCGPFAGIEGTHGDSCAAHDDH